MSPPPSTRRSRGSALSTTQSGNRAKAYLYCLGNPVPEDGLDGADGTVVGNFHRLATWSRSWFLITRTSATRSKFIQGFRKRIWRKAENGTVRDGRLVHPDEPGTFWGGDQDDTWRLSRETA